MTAFTLDTDRRIEVRDVTDRVEAALPADADGTATVFARHTTAVDRSRPSRTVTSGGSVERSKLVCRIC